MIKLNDKYEIGFDPLNIILYKVGVKGESARNPGEKSRTVIGYYSNFEYMVNNLIVGEILDCREEYSELEDIVNKINEFEIDICNKIKEIEDER